ncbi:MAG: hypothetical protein HYU47_03775 [Deltaproteobacteria bacterium]|nr:hypothetical protein [Deltaproteobacteria bacterium]
MENLQGLVFSELPIPTWQLVLYTVLTCIFILTRRIRSFLLTTCVFALYWTFHFLRAQWFAAAGGEFLGPAIYGFFSLVLVGLSLHAVFFFREQGHFPGLSSYEIGRLRRSLLKRMDQMESAILQAEARAAHEIKEFEEIRQNMETRVGPLEDHVHRMDENLRSRRTAVEDLESELLSRIHDLESQVSEKGELLRSRDKEIEGLRAEMEEQARKVEVQREEGEERIRGQEAAGTKTEEEVAAAIRDLERQLAEKEALLIARNREIKGLYQEEREDRQESSFREQEEKLSARVSRLEEELREKEAQLKESHQQLQDVRSELEAKTVWLQKQLLEKERGEKSKEPLLAEIEALNKRIRELENLARENDSRSQILSKGGDTRASGADEKAATLQILLQEQDESFARRTASYQEVVESLTARIKELEKQLKENGTPAHAHNGEKSRKRGRGVQAREESGDPTPDTEDTPARFGF